MTESNMAPEIKSKIENLGFNQIFETSATNHTENDHHEMTDEVKQ